MNVKLIRMWSGEDVVTDLVEETEDTIKIVNPIVGVPDGQGQVRFAPWSPLVNKRDVVLEVTKKYIVYINVPQEGIVDQYEDMFGVLQTPKKKLIM